MPEKVRKAARREPMRQWRMIFGGYEEMVVGRIYGVEWGGVASLGVAYHEVDDEEEDDQDGKPWTIIVRVWRLGLQLEGSL